MHQHVKVLGSSLVHSGLSEVAAFEKDGKDIAVKKARILFVMAREI